MKLMKQHKSICFINLCIFCLIFVHFLILPFTLEAKERTVRVGWYYQPSYMQLRSDGTPYGYNYEYLQNISRYTGWKYEFVHGDFEDLYADLVKGKIDILGCVFYSGERTSVLSFPNYSAGEDYVTLFTKADSRMVANDYKSFNGIRVGSTTKNNMNRFVEFAKENGFTAKTRYYRSFRELTAAVTQGKIDAAVYGGFQPDPLYKTIASFAPSSFYFVTTKNNTEILSGLNSAIAMIKLHNPYFDRDLSRRYLPREYAHFVLTEEEKTFVASLPPIKVGHTYNWAPFEYVDSQTGEYKGICKDLFEKISEISGLKFEYITAQNVGEMNKQIDVVSSVVNDFDEAKKACFFITEPYLKIPVMVIKKKNSKLSANTVTATPVYNCLYQSLREKGYDFIFYKTAAECLNALETGKVDQVMINSLFAEFMLKKRKYANLSAVMLQNCLFEPCVGVRDDLDPRLYTILNRAIFFISQAEMNNIIIKNTIDLQEGSIMTIVDKLSIDTIIVVCIVLLSIIVLLLFLIRARSQSMSKIRTILYQDALTGALSQFGFEEETSRLLSNDERKFFIVDFDISRFENYNILHGVTQGNALLCMIIQIIEGHKDEFVLCARIYADHFVVLIAADSYELVIKRINCIDAIIKKELKDSSIIINYGIYEIVNRKLAVKEMIDRARAAKRTVKGNASNYIGLYDSAIHDKEREDGEIISCMNESLAKGEFTSYYQPKYDAHTEKLVGAEALVRWVRQDGKMIFPDRFIKLFEQSGQIIELDICMLEQVCKTQRDFIDDGINPVPISVNFSPIHLYDRSFVESVNQMTDKYRVPHHLIEIEFTESAMIENLKAVKNIITALHRSGYLVAMDDFGSGYSSLNVLKELSVDVVKLDREFMKFEDKTQKGELVVQSVIKLAKKLSLVTVAEGVEIEPQLDFLRICGCDIIQGYYFSKPVDRDTYKKMLLSRTN